MRLDFAYHAWLIASLCVSLAGTCQAEVAAHSDTRSFTVADSIEMTRIGTPRFEYTTQQAAQFSPDGSKFVIVTRRGNLRNNTNEYSLLLFYTAKAFQSPIPEVLVTLASSSDQPAIDNLRWLDNRRIMFLGERPGEREQVCVYDLKTHRMRKVTHQSMDVVRFDATADLRTLVFLTKPPLRNIVPQETLSHGLVISNQELGDLLIGHSSDKEYGIIYPLEFFVQHRGGKPIKIDFANDNPRPECAFSLSPDGRYVVVWTFLYKVPGDWKRYQDAVKPGSYVFRYVVVDTVTGSVKPLLNAPLSWKSVYSEIGWMADSKSVVIANTYLPSSVRSARDLTASAKDTFVAEISLVSGTVSEILKGDLELLSMDRVTGTVFLRPRDGQDEDIVAYRKNGKSWVKANTHDAVGKNLVSFQPLQIQEIEGMNMPPRLVVADKRAGIQRSLLDLNPQFRQVKLAQVEEIFWKGKDGNSGKGGLYLPPGYRPDHRYPLVIQTHGWDSKKFRPDGVSTAGYAAQALAAKGIVVVQADDDVGQDETTVREAPRETAMYEGLIDFLDGRALIDRNNVGMFAWSRTGFHVRHAVEFSRYHFQAAVIVDGMDASYFQYLVDVQWPEATEAYEHLHGAPPFGPGLETWLQNATGFNLEKVHTPTRLVSFGPRSILYNWEWFAGLKHLGKPVELMWLPDTMHIPVKPLEELTVQQGTVDWFCFWLKGEEDADASKAEQYVRWRQLKTSSP